MIIFPGGVRQKRNFRRGGGVRFESQFLENPEGRGGHRKNPFRGGGMDIFWNYTLFEALVRLKICHTRQERCSNGLQRNAKFSGFFFSGRYSLK